MKKNILFKFLLTFGGILLLCACVVEYSGQMPEGDGVSTGDDQIIYKIKYTVTVVNTTDKKVQLYGPGYFDKYLSDDKAEIKGTVESRTIVCTIPAKERQTGAFYWDNPKHSFYEGSCDPAVETYRPPIETIKANFKPYIASFYLKFTIDSDEYYLAGWPAADGNNLVDYLGKPFSFPANKIKAYGIGYCENTDIRIDENGYAYIPFTLNYDGKSSDFGNESTWLTATATLTINSPDDIQFKTTSLK